MGQRCERKDGSFYGTGGTCRKGVEAPYTAEDLKAEYSRIKKEREIDIDKSLKSIDFRLPAAMDAETRRLEKIGQGLLGMDSGELTKYKKRYEELLIEVEGRLNKGEFTKKDLDYYLEHAGIEIPRGVSTVNVGMEWGLAFGGGLNKDNAGEAKNEERFFKMVNKNLAGHYARTRLEEELPEGKKTLGQVLSWSPSGKADLPGSTYHGNIFTFNTLVGGSPVVRKESAIPGRAKIGEIELRPMPANGTGNNKSNWPYPHMEWVKKDPELSKILATRDSYYAYSDEKRAKVLSKNLAESFKTGELKSVFFSTGKTNAEVTRSMIDQFLKDNPSAVSHEIKYQRGTNSESKVPGRIIDVDGKGSFIYDLGHSVSAQGLSWPNAAASLLNERDRILQERASKLTDKMP